MGALRHRRDPVIVRDVTESKRAQLEVQRSHLELAHVSRVTTLGEITASLAHELNQPLTVILSNAQAAQRLLASNKLHEVDMNELLDDIVQADKRGAGDASLRDRAMADGAVAFLQKPFTDEQLIRAIDRALERRRESEINLGK